MKSTSTPVPISASEELVAIEITSTTTQPQLKVTRIEVTGMCCQSEVTLIERKLSAMPGVGNISINLMTRQVAVTHDAAKTAPEKLVRTLNWSFLGASLVSGTSRVGLKRGRFSFEGALAVLIGLLWLPSFGIWVRDDETDWTADPFSWTALACVVVGSPVMLARAISGVFYQRTINMFATMCIATIGACIIRDFWEVALRPAASLHVARRSRAIPGVAGCDDCLLLRLLRMAAGVVRAPHRRQDGGVGRVAA